MTGTSLAGILTMAAVIVLGLVTWLVLVFWASRRPQYKGQRPDPRPGDVRGGAFLGGGRSVMPRRDAPPEREREWPAQGSGAPVGRDGDPRH